MTEPAQTVELIQTNSTPKLLLPLLLIPVIGAIGVFVAFVGGAASSSTATFNTILMVDGIYVVATLIAVFVAHTRHSQKWAQIALWMPFIVIGLFAVYGTVVTLIEFYGGLLRG